MEKSIWCTLPALDEFEVGCTYQHAGYFLTWLYNFFGPVKSSFFFQSVYLKIKCKKKIYTPDFSVGCLEYDEVIARVTLKCCRPT